MSNTIEKVLIGFPQEELAGIEAERAVEGDKRRSAVKSEKARAKVCRPPRTKVIRLLVQEAIAARQASRSASISTPVGQ